MLSIPRPQRVNVRTNAFEVTRLPSVVVVQYQTFEPVLKGAAIERRQRYMEHLQIGCAPELFPQRMMYDGGAVGFTTHDVAGLIGPQRVFYIKLNINGQLSPNDFNPNAKERDPCIKITFQRTVSVPIRPEDIAKIYRGDLEAQTRSEALTNLLQLIIRQGTNNRFVTRGKAYYDMEPKNMKSLEGGLELRRGIWHSARPADNRLILMIDTVSTAFYPGGKLADVMGNFLRERDIWRISKGSRNWPKMVKYFTRLRVKSTVPAKAKNFTKTIKGFEPEGGLFKFNYHGDFITVQEYYWTAYQVRVQHPKAPGVVLQIRGDFKSVVPLEFVELLPEQIFKQKIPEDLTKEMVRFSSVRPGERSAQIMAAAKVYRQQENMAAVNMSVSENPLVVPGNFYPAPTLLYGDRTEPGPRDGKWNVVDRKFIMPTGLAFWGIVNCAPLEVHGRQLDDLIQMLRRCCQSHGMGCSPPAPVQNCPGGSGLSQALDRVLHQILNGDPGKREKSVILVILPNSAADLRASVKFWGDIQTGVQTQCLRSQGNRGIKTGDQYVNNLLLKINARFGGINFVVGSSPTFIHLHTPLPSPQNPKPEITGGNTIIFGADVSHPGPGVFSKPSVTSIVFSTDKHGTKYAAITEIQDPRVERITQLGPMVFRALKRYALCIQGPPINIIFYRDGLSEGEYDTTAKAEMGDIEVAINKFMASEKGYSEPNAPPRPKLTYIVVGKRHHALLFPAAAPGARDILDDGKGNCKGGVAVHEGITQPYRYIADFYLQSHAAIQGTSRSSHYVVLRDDIFSRWGNQRIEALEEYSYALCHMYAKATRTVSIPAPVYYADLVCQRGAFHVNPNAGSFNFEDDSAASATGSAKEQRKAFDLSGWQAVFQPVNNDIKNRMYYL